MNTTRHLATIALAFAAIATAPATAQCTTFSPGAYWQSVGPGCGTPPALFATADPHFGTVVSLVAGNFDPSIVLAVFAVKVPPAGAAPLPTMDLVSIPLPAGCSNWLADADAYVLELAVGGTASLALAIPNSGFLLGDVVRAQAFGIGFTSAYLVPEVSNSVCLYLGP